MKIDRLIILFMDFVDIFSSRIFFKRTNFFSTAFHSLWSILFCSQNSYYDSKQKKIVFFYFNFPFWTFLFARQLSFYPCLRPLSFRRCDLICECICVLSVDSIFFGFSSPSPVSVIICNSDYLYYEREREIKKNNKRKKFKQRYTKHRRPLNIACSRVSIHIYSGIVYWIFN